jgi:hypothetical protein
VVIDQIDPDATVWDEQAREPVRQTKTKRITVNAQVKWFQMDDPKAMEAGVHLGARGYLLFSTYELREAGISINRQDRVIKIGYMDVEDTYIRGFAPMGHYPDQNGAGLLKAYFGDKPKAA